MSVETKKKKAEAMGIDLSKIEGELTETKLDELIEQKSTQLAQDKEEKRIREAAEKKAADEAKKNLLVLKDVDGHDVDQEDYFWPRLEDEKTLDGKILKATTKTAPANFNRMCGYPVDREELIEVFLQYFPRRKGFLFYKARDKELYMIIIPLRYAKTISRSNESRPGDHQRHAISFITEGSVNIDSLKLRLKRIAAHTDILTEALA